MCLSIIMRHILTTLPVHPARRLCPAPRHRQTQRRHHPAPLPSRRLPRLPSRVQRAHPAPTVDAEQQTRIPHSQAHSEAVGHVPRVGHHSQRRVVADSHARRKRGADAPDGPVRTVHHVDARFCLERNETVRRYVHDLRRAAGVWSFRETAGGSTVAPRQAQRSVPSFRVAVRPREDDDRL